LKGIAMSTSSISSATPSYQPPQNGGQQNFQALVQAVQSGNLTAAQQAYATLTQNAPQGASTTAGGQANPFQQAISTIGSALQSGDISGAQNALQTMQQTMKSHHGHRHHTAPDQDASNTAAPASTGISTLSGATNTLDVSA
jgi:soluble cytochrome b562